MCVHEFRSCFVVSRSWWSKCAFTSSGAASWVELMVVEVEIKDCLALARLVKCEGPYGDVMTSRCARRVFMYFWSTQRRWCRFASCSEHDTTTGRWGMMERIWCVMIKVIAKSPEDSICYAMACSSCLRIQDCWGMKWLAHHGVMLSAMRWNKKWRPTMHVSSKRIGARWYAGACWEGGMADGSEMEEKWHSQCQHVSETDQHSFGAKIDIFAMPQNTKESVLKCHHQVKFLIDNFWPAACGKGNMCVQPAQSKRRHPETLLSEY